MIAFQPDPSFLSGTLPNAGALPQPEANPGGGAVANNRAALDFAGLVNAALPGGKTSAGSGAARGAIAGPDVPAFPADVPAPPAQAPAPINAPTLIRELPHAPGGTILPGHGVSLPPQTAIAPVPIAPTPIAPAPIAVAGPAAAPVSALHDQAEVDAEAEDQLAAEPTPDAGVLAGLTPPAITPPIPAPPPAPVTPPTAAVAAATLQPATAPARNAAAPARQPEPGARQGAVEAGKGTPQAGPSQAGRVPIRAEHAALPAAVPGDVLTELGGEARDTGSATSSAAPTPTPAVLADPALAADASAPAPSAQPNQLTAAPATERSEPRAPSPQQESTIAAVGELREALRAARPELTLRHAEFGPVSLRLEQVAGQDWRAVLASRDPGFVPAIQAALSERAITAAAETASTNGNTNGNTGQNGASDQRYGASPNGGQGSSQPYLAQSSNRDDGGQNHGQPPSQQRQPRTTDTVAARAGDSDAARADPRDRGVFA